MSSPASGGLAHRIRALFSRPKSSAHADADDARIHALLAEMERPGGAEKVAARVDPNVTAPSRSALSIGGFTRPG